METVQGTMNEYSGQWVITEVRIGEGFQGESGLVTSLWRGHED